MAAAEWWCWPLPAWLGSGAAWFVLLNVVVGAIFALSTRAQPQSPSPRRGITRRASSMLLQRLRSFSIFNSPSSSFHMDMAPDSPATFRRTEETATSARTRSPSTPRAVTPPAAAEATAPVKEEEDANPLTMDDVYALVQARRQQPPLTEEEAASSEVDAKAGGGVHPGVQGGSQAAAPQLHLQLHPDAQAPRRRPRDAGRRAGYQSLKVLHT